MEYICKRAYRGGVEEKPAVIFLIFASGITLGVIICTFFGGLYVAPADLSAPGIQVSASLSAEPVEIAQTQDLPTLR